MKELAAEKIRALLKARIARLLGCEPQELPHMKIGSMTHFLFLALGDDQSIGGFHTSMSMLLQILGHELVWDVEPKVEEAAPKAVVVN